MNDDELRSLAEACIEVYDGYERGELPPIERKLLAMSREVLRVLDNRVSDAERSLDDAISNSRRIFKLFTEGSGEHWAWQAWRSERGFEVDE